MSLYLFTNGWEFRKFPVDASFADVSKAWEEVWEKVDLPHDWLIGNAKNLYENATGWYRRTFFWDAKKQAGKVCAIRFDGVYMDSAVYVNGTLLGEWKYGYSTFEFDMTSLLKDGENTILVRSTNHSPNSRWYSGAGIYRKVSLRITPEVHFAADGICFHARKMLSGNVKDAETYGLPKAKGAEEHWFVDVRAEVVKSSGFCDGESGNSHAGSAKDHPNGASGNSISCENDNCSIRLRIREKKSGKVILEQETDEVILEQEFGKVIPNREIGNAIRAHEIGTEKRSEEVAVYQTMLSVQSPHLWDLDDPFLYTLEAELLCGEELLDSFSGNLGFRTISLTTDQGLYLNGRRIKLQGVCEHHDLGALGAAFDRSAMARKLRILKTMGVNAIRTSHNMPAPEVMDLADEMGFLVNSEAFDMWMRPKTEYDYARFFPAWWKKDVASWVRRDRNHPSLLFWSIGNEIYDMHADPSAPDLAEEMAREVRKYDVFEQGYVTFGSNYMPWEGAQKCADRLKVAGYNYGEQLYAKHHKKHPDWIIYGSETASVVYSRGIYHFPLAQSVLADDDLQCSALGNSCTSWGAKNPEYTLLMEEHHPFSLGQFLWTGFDYIGEPTPYHTKNSYFGQFDTAGFAKDAAFLYRAGWTDSHTAPFVHVLPYWDFNEGQMIDVRVISNAASVELFVNGVSMGRVDLIGKQVETDLTDLSRDPGREDGGADTKSRRLTYSGDYRVEYVPGTICGVAYDEEGREVAREVHHSFGDAAALRIDVEPIMAEGGDRVDPVMPGSENDVPLDRSSERIDSTFEGRTVSDGSSLIFLQISALDDQGFPVENAGNRVHVTVSGPGRLVGLDNGDGTDFDDYQSSSRKLFSGKLLAIVAPKPEEGEIVVRVDSPGLQGAEVRIPVKPSGECQPVFYDSKPFVYAEVCNRDVTKIQNRDVTEAIHGGMKERLNHCADDRIPVRKITLRPVMPEGITSVREALSFGPGHRSVVVEAIISPSDASFRNLTWRPVLDGGATSNLAVITPLDEQGHKALVEAKGDGDFRIRVTSQNDQDHVEVMSHLECHVSGLGTATVDPYGFVVGSTFRLSSGNIGNGNERGFASANGAVSYAAFPDCDFGPIGSEEVTLPIFELGGDPVEPEFYDGIPGEGGELIGIGHYHKKSIWNTYQNETFRLNRKMKGVRTFSILMRGTKIHIKGFSFTKPVKAYETLTAADRSAVYGDSYTVCDTMLTGIGNNVSVIFEEMDFVRGLSRVRITGRAPKSDNTIHLIFSDGQMEERRALEFKACEELTEQTFDLEPLSTLASGPLTVTWVFLPGSCFDLAKFRFEA